MRETQIDYVKLTCRNCPQRQENEIVVGLVINGETFYVTVGESRVDMDSTVVNLMADKIVSDLRSRVVDMLLSQYRK